MAVQYCNYDIKGTLAVTGVSSFTGTATFGTHIIPALDNTSDLGTTNSKDFRTLYIREIDIYNQRFKLDSTGTIARLQDHTTVGDGFQFMHLGTEILRLGNGSSTTATFSGRVGLNGTTPSDFNADADDLIVGGGSGDVGITIYSGSSVGDYGAIYFADGTTGSAEYKGIISYEQNNEIMRFHTNTTEALKLDLAQNATFAGDITVSGGDITLGGTGRIQGVDTVSASTDAANKAYVDAHVSPAGTYLPLIGGTMSGPINMGDNDIDGIDELKFSSGTKLGDVGGTNYMRLTYANSNNGGLQVVDNDGQVQGYLYGDGGATSSFGLLDGSGSFAVKCVENAGVELFYSSDNTKKFETTNTGVTVTGAMSVGAINTTGTLDISSSYPRINLNDTTNEDDWSIINDDGSFTIYNVDDNVHALKINGSNDITISNDLTVSGGDIILSGTGRIQGVDTVSAGTDAANKAYVDASIPSLTNYVTLDTAQTITGSKSFTSQVTIDTAGGSERMRFYNENNTAPIADTFSGNTSKSYIYFDVVAGSNDPGFIMHESSSTETNEGVLHLAPSDDNSTLDYVSIHGTNDPDCIRLHTSGLIETGGNYQLQLKSGSGNIYLNDSVDIASNLLVSGTATITSDLTVNGGDITLGGTGRIQGIDTVSASTDAANKSYVDTQIATIPSGLNFQGNWNASTNSPTLASGTGTPGFYYNVSVAGSTNLDGETDWQIGDWAVFVEAGATDKWEKIDNTSALTGVGANTQVSLWGGTNTLEGSTALTFTGGDLYVTGDGNSSNWYSAYQDTITAFSATSGSTTVLTLTQRDGGTITTSFVNPQGTTTGSFTSGRIPFANSATNLIDSSNLLWNNGTSKLNVRGAATALANQPCIPMLIDNAGSVDGRVMLQIKTNDVSSASAQGAGITLTAPQNITGTYDPVNSLIFLQTKSPGNQTIHSAPKNIKFYVDNDGTGAGAGTDYNAFGDLAFELFDSGIAKAYYEFQVAGLLNLANVPNATSDTDKFLVSDGGEVKYRTGAQVLSDIGAASSGSLGNYLPLSAGSSYPLTGDLYLDDGSGASPSIYLKNGSDNYWRLINGSTGILALKEGTTDILTFAAGGNATFANNVTATNILTVAGAATGNPFLQFTQGGTQKAYIQYVDSGDSFELQSDNQFVVRTGGSTVALTINSSQEATFVGDIKQGNRIVLQDNGTIQWGNSADYGNLSWDTGYALIYGQSGNGIKFGTNGSTLALTLDTSQNATFAGDVTADQFISTNNGNGQNYKVGDDVWLGDINVANTMRISGNQDSSKGFITFGSNNTTLGRSGTGALTWGGDFQTTGDVTVSGGDITLGGTGRIQGVDTVSAGTDAANKDYVDTAVGTVPVGTVTSVSSSTTSQLTVSQSSPAPALSIVTAAVANGGTALATGNQIYDWGVAAFAPIVSGGYLPLSGGTLTGDLRLNDNVELELGSDADIRMYHDNSNGYINSFKGDLYIRTFDDDKDIVFQSDNGSGGTTEYFRVDGSFEKTVFSKDIFLNDSVKALFGNSSDLQIYHDGSNSYIQETGTGELIISSGTVLRLRSDASPTGEEYINCTRDGAVALFYNNVEKFHTSASGVDVLGDLTVDTTAVIDGATTINGQLNQNGDIKLSASASIVLDDTPTASTASGSGTIVEWSVSVSVTAGTLYVIKSDGGWTTADADSEAKSTAMAAIALGSNATSGMLLQGFFYKASHGFAIGSPLYISNTAGAFTNSRPTGTGDYVRIIGYATSTNYIYFDPDKTWVKID